MPSQKAYTKTLTHRLAFALVSAVTTLSVAAATPERVKLVVGVVVEGLSLDQLALLQDQLGDRGFNRLMREGVTIEDLDYGSPLDPAAATAMVYTGASPSVSGVDASTAFDRSKRHMGSIFLDDKETGSHTSEALSPRALAVSTIGDELRIATGGVGAVHTLALSPEQAIAMAGHAGNSAHWLNTVNGTWASSSYYKEPPTALQARNRYAPVSARIDTMAWTPSIAMSAYPALPEHRKIYPFRITFDRRNPQRFKQFAVSALANREVTSIATEYIRSLKLGEREEPDMLNITYNLSPYPYTTDGDTRVSTMDAYLRLDSDLANLMEAIDRGPGMGSTVLFITGTPPPSRTRRDPERWQIPYGEFSRRKAMSLLNSFLMARYGNGDWVIGLDDNQVYLNRELASQRGKSIEEMRLEAAAFLTRMSGVTSAITVDDVIAGRGGERSLALRRNVALSHSGDIFITLAPGWAVVDEEGKTPEAQNLVTRTVATTAPAFILAPAVAPQRISTSTDARVIAPTVAGILRIRSPNGAELPSLRLH
ncbi:MAG: alkaline phosphatase family protein [Bacteroidales bacterium]|nr:alkaline phosphatase family protein [Bacteroidales bacterium]